MPDYRRARIPGGTYFFTVVTNRRHSLFTDSTACRLLGECLREAKERWPFEVNAIVLLPDHLHAIWSLPRGDDRNSLRWSWIKKEFTKRWLQGQGSERSISVGRQREGRRGIWQPRFWEHTIEEDEDFDRHFDYAHYNPVKHGLVRCPHEWLHSSFHRWVKAGVYPKDWACGGESTIVTKLKDMENSVGE